MPFRFARLHALLAGALVLALLAPTARAQEALLRLADTPDARRVVVYVARDDGTPHFAQPTADADLVLAFRPAGDRALTLPDVNSVLKKVTLKQGVVTVGATQHATPTYDGARVLTAHYPARVLDLSAPFLVRAPTGPAAALYLGDLPVGTPAAPAPPSGTNAPGNGAPAPTPDGDGPVPMPSGSAAAPTGGEAGDVAADDEASADETGPTIYDVGSVDVPPEPEGGLKALYGAVRYPRRAQARGIEGRVFVQFVVHKDGSVSGIEVVRSAHDLLDREAARVVRETVFRPAQRDGEPVACLMTQPITFKMR
jgi:protein TonB